MKSVAKKDEAVSPVIGTILLVAITVVLVAIVAAVVMGMVGGVGQSKTVGITAQPFSNTSVSGFTLTITGGPDAGSLVNITAYMEGVTFENPEIESPTVGVPQFVKVSSTDLPATGALTLTGSFTDGSKYVIYQNQFSIPATPTTQG
ncbi:type IV pilin [Methanocorpusculum sp. MG]|uniref:Type IV pilin n=1 Tax=Methanocorpusculum petauri TaxID=3002863 RepID=A0ABT4IFK6_9EURY|nr:type IV pilin [Methanocorpusculum petauri]MCZ0860356.1 type IV pilin [Methanocorpusculum petauri]MDE2444185.1 type IV pilin [Methanocorpusculum sp.]